MHICLPALATAGLFAAVIILDVFNRDYKLILGHILLGFVSLLLVLYLCQKDAEKVAWALFITPFVLIFLGWILGQLQAVSGKTQPTVSLPSSSGIQMEKPAMYGYGGGCPVCTEYPCCCVDSEVGNPVDASGNVIEKRGCLNSALLPSA
jgi:hypothetical protein